MNVLYDISILGRTYGEAGYKTGIPRVVEELMYRLLVRPDCRIELCSSLFLLGSLEYAQADPRLQALRFPHNTAQVAIQRKHRASQSAVDASSAGLTRFTLRAERKMLHYAEQFSQASAQVMDPAALRDADIYHSTYLALPKQLKGVSHPLRFLTIYDMIPTLFPQYCNDYVKKLFGSILASIDDETWLLSISEATKNDFCRHLKIDPARVFVTPLAADPDLFYPVTDAQELARVRQKHEIKPAPYVLSLCALAPHKNIEHVIRSFVRLMQEGKTPDLQLVLAGAKGWNYDHIFAEIDGAEALKSQIVVTGFVANEDLAALYTGAMTFVFPSLYEGFGLPPLEAMQCGVPVITSNTSSLPEVVGDAGIMLDPKDADGLCGALLSLYEDADLRADMAAKSLLRAKGFSWERCTEETVQAYKTALER